MKEYSIDRFEGEQAILIDRDQKTITVLKNLLPAGAAEGDVLLFDGVQYHIDQALTEQRRAEVKQLISKLFR